MRQLLCPHRCTGVSTCYVRPYCTLLTASDTAGSLTPLLCLTNPQAYHLYAFRWHLTLDGWYGCGNILRLQRTLYGTLSAVFTLQMAWERNAPKYLYSEDCWWSPLYMMLQSRYVSTVICMQLCWMYRPILRCMHEQRDQQ